MDHSLPSIEVTLSHLEAKYRLILDEYENQINALEKIIDEQASRLRALEKWKIEAEKIVEAK